MQSVLSMPGHVRAVGGEGGGGRKEDPGSAALHPTRLHDSSQSGQERASNIGPNFKRLMEDRAPTRSMTDEDLAFHRASLCLECSGD